MFDLRSGESAPTLWAALAFFAILASYFVLKPVRDALVLEGDPDFLPWLFTSTFVVMTLISAPWGALVARLPRHRLVPFAFRACMAQLLVFVGLFAWNGAPVVVGKVFYVWLSVFNLFVVSVFWSLCADLARPEQGQRLFGPIATGGSAGTIAGTLVTRDLVHLPPWVLLLIACALLEAAVWAMARVERHGRRLREAAAEAHVHVPAAAPPAADDRRGRAVGGHPLSGLSHLRSPYLAGIAAYVLCTAYLATFIYLEQSHIAKAALPDSIARRRFFADVELYTGLITIGLQAFATSRLLRWFGAGVVLAVLPILQGAGLALLTAVPTLAMATVVSSIGRAATHSLARPSRELLYTAIDREDRFKAKNVIDTLVYRLGDTSSSWLSWLLAYLGVAVTAVGVPLAGAWVGLAWLLGANHRRRTTAPAAQPGSPEPAPAAP